MARNTVYKSGQKDQSYFLDLVHLIPSRLVLVEIKPHSMYYSHYGNWVRNGAISIMQWVLLSDAYKVNTIGERKNSGNRNWVCKYVGAKFTLHIALSKRPINQFSKADNRCLELSVLIYILFMARNMASRISEANAISFIQFVAGA